MSRYDLIANDTHLSIEEVAVAMRVIEREIENEQEFRQNHLNDLRDRMKGDAKIASRIHSCPDCDNAMVLFGAHHMDIHRRNALPNVLAETYGLDVSVYIIKDDKILARPGALRGGGSALVPQERLSEGVAPDEQEPLLRDAVQGDPESQYSLAKHFGLKAPQDRTEMIWWLSQSASHGHAEALYQLAMVYGDPLSLDLDEVKAFPLALRAATLGHVYSQVLVGKYYYEAVGTTKDDALSHMWYLRAAQAGDSVAQSVVGYNYLVGCGVGLDHVEARRWLEAAAAQGDQDALRNTRYLKDRI